MSTGLVVLGIALWLAGSFTAPSAAAPKSEEPLTESDTGFTAPDGVVVSPTAENCNGMIPTSPSADHFKTLTGGTLEPAGTATYRITFPTGTEPFEIADCVLFAEPDEAGAYPAQLSSYDVLTKASFIGVATDAGQFDLDVSLQLPADIAVGTRVCNVAKSTEKRPLGDTAGGGHRKAGPACFIVGGDHRIEKHGSDTNGSPISADNPATFSFDCTNAAQDPSAQPLIISWTDASDDTSQTHEIATASASDLEVEANIIAVNGASGSSCTVTETTPPDGYDLPTDEADQSQTFTLGVGASQTVVTFVDPVQSCQTGCGSTTGSTDIEKRGTDTEGEPIASNNPATFRFTSCVNADSETTLALSWIDATGASQEKDLGSATFPLDVQSNELTLAGATGSSCNVTETVAPKGYGLTSVSTAAPTKVSVASATDPVVFTNPVSQTCTTACNSTTTTTSTTVFVSTGNTTDENARTTETPTTNPPPTVRVLSHELARTGSETRTYLTFAGLALLLGGVAVMFGEPSAAAARRGR